MGWTKYQLEVRELEVISVEAEFPIKNEKLTIGILGNIPGDFKSLAIVLISLNIDSH
jgi:hypothetical protein